MADFTSLKATIQQYIKQNGNEEITGAILQDVLLSMVDTMGDSAINTLTQDLSDEITARRGADSTLQGNIDSLGLSHTALATFISSGYIFRGIANQSTVPSSLNGKVFYLTSTSGQYSNMGNITVQAGISALLYDGEAWSAVLLIAMDNAPTEDSGNMVKSGGVHSVIASEAARALAAETNSVEFNSTTKYLIFKNSAGTVLYQMDASVFVIDGMVQNVEIKDVTISGQTVTCLVISFNTDAGKQDINIPLTQIFNPANYYDKTAIDALLLPVTTRLNAGYLYMGLATVAGTPDTSKGKVFYLTATAGTYTNYGNTVVADGLTILSYDGSAWTGTLLKGLDSTPTQNSTNLITSGGVFAAIKTVADKLAEGYLYKGIATTVTNPDTPTTKVFYMATGAGTYTNFLDSNSQALVLTQGINILKYNGSAWSSEQVIAIDNEPTAGSDNLVKSGGLDGTTVKEPNFTNGFIGSNGVFVSNDNYRCSDFMPCDLIYAIQATSNAIININLYNERKEHLLYKFILDNEVYALIPKDYKYFRFWATPENLAKISFIWNGSEVTELNDNIERFKTELQNHKVDTNGYLDTKWEHCFIDSNNVITRRKDYSCSQYIDIDSLFAILTDGTISSGTLIYYDSDGNKVSYEQVTFSDSIRSYTPNKSLNAKYIRFWFTNSDLDVASTKVKFIMIPNELNVNSQSKMLSEYIHGESIIKPMFKFGFVGSQGIFVNNYNYCISDFFSIDRFDKVVSKVNGTNISYNLYTAENYSTIIVYNSSPNELDISELRKKYPTASYITIWTSSNNPYILQNSLIFVPTLRGGLVNEIRNNFYIKSQKNQIYLNNCKTKDDFQSCILDNGVYTDNTDNIIVNSNGIVAPYSAGAFTWIRKHIRNAKKTCLYDFYFDENCTAIGILGFGVCGGANGINSPEIRLDIANNVISLQGVNTPYTFTANVTYRLKIYQEDKHTEISVINLASGISSQVVVYNGQTDGNIGLYYDTWCFGPRGGAMVIRNVEVVSFARQPFLAMIGDSITVGFSATVVDGINHNKFAYLVGEETGRDYFSSGRGGGSFQNLLGGSVDIDGLRNLTFDGILESEIKPTLPNYVMITIGTNGGGTYLQYKQVVDYVISLGLTPILNTLPIRADGDNDENVSYVASANENIMQIWKDYNIHGARFDLATSLNNNGHTINADMFASDKIHPNDAGHAAMAARVMLDCPELFD